MLEKQILLFIHFDVMKLVLANSQNIDKKCFFFLAMLKA